MGKALYFRAAGANFCVHRLTKISRLAWVGGISNQGQKEKHVNGNNIYGSVLQFFGGLHFSGGVSADHFVKKETNRGQ
jgi:hypothetical protein